MTKVTYIHGVPGSQSQPIPKKKVPARFIDYRSMTDGELRLALMAEQLAIVAEYYGSDEHKALQNNVEAALNRGIHGTSIAPVTGQMGQLVADEIARAARMRRPAGGIMLPKSKTLGNPLIDLQDCTQFMNFSEDQFGNFGTETPESRACHQQNEGIQMLNQHLEGSAHHLLYEYITNNQTATVSAKKVLHRNAVSKLADITAVNRNNLKLWMRNGIMRNNVKFGADPLQPQDVIDTLAASAGGSGVGVPFLVMLPALISAIAAAVGATVGLVQSVKAEKRNQLLLAAQGIGSQTFGPERGDWSGGTGTGFNTPGSPGSPGANSNTPGSPGAGTNFLDGDMTPLLLGGAALLLLNR